MIKRPLFFDNYESGELYREFASLADIVQTQTTLSDVIALDTETTDIDPRRADLVGLSLATAPGKACYVPVGHVADEGGLGPHDELGAALLQLLGEPMVQRQLGQGDPGQSFGILLGHGGRHRNRVE